MSSNYIVFLKLQQYTYILQEPQKGEKEFSSTFSSSLNISQRKGNFTYKISKQYTKSINHLVKKKEAERIAALVQLSVKIHPSFV